jgi:hypothetical protein
MTTTVSVNTSSIGAVGGPPPSQLAAHQRDAARARVRRIAVGTTTMAVVLAGVGAVALAAPSAPNSSTAIGTSSSNGPTTSGVGASVSVAAGTGQPPAAASGGS